ncbi:MAG: encapsulin [Chloroflexi bacterium]|nr:encapsulin [Chloroflexota bacterium]
MPSFVDPFSGKTPRRKMTLAELVRAIRLDLAEGVFKAPVLARGGLLMASGKAFASVVVGQDMSMGFVGPVGERLEFAISESLAPLIKEPRAVCVLSET